MAAQAGNPAHGFEVVAQAAHGTDDQAGGFELGAQAGDEFLDGVGVMSSSQPYRDCMICSLLTMRLTRAGPGIRGPPIRGP